MNDLVFLEPNKIDAIPFTTSDVIAEYADINYRSVQRTIENQIKRLEKLGQVRIEITPVKYGRGTNDKKIYHLTEAQATLLITFLKNTDKVADFKTELVRQFYLMRSELQKRQTLRIQLKPIRRELTDVIQDDPNHNQWSFKIFTDLAYIAVTGTNAAKLRRLRNARPTDKAIDYMTSDEIERVTKLQSQIAVLYEMGLDYQQIKAMLLNRVARTA